MATAKKASARKVKRLSTGVDGLDDVLSGGLAPNRLYLIEGVPGRARRVERVERNDRLRPHPGKVPCKSGPVS